MSFVAKVLPFVVVATLAAACSDVSAPTQAVSGPGSALAAKGGVGGGGGGAAAGGTQPVVATPATVNATGTWVGTTDGPDVPHTYTLILTQTADGTVRGASSFTTATIKGSELVVGTVNGDTLSLYGGPGTVCAGCQLTLYYRGIVSSNASRIDGSFVVGGSPLRLFKQ